VQLLINALIAGSLAALLAGGLAFVYGVLGAFNVALGQMALSGGYATWWLQAHGVPLSLSILGGLLFSVVISVLTFEIFVNPFYRHHRFLPLVTTIAWSMILDGILLFSFGGQPRNIVSDAAKKPFHILGATMNNPQAILILSTIVLLLLCAYILHSTAFGRRIRAVVQHEHAAMSLGIPAGLLSRILFISSGVLACFAGIFLGIDQNLTPAFGFALTIKAYAAVIAGGKGNVWGAVVCAYLIALIEQLIVGVHWFGRFYFPAGFQSTISLLIIIGVLLIKPSGLFRSSARVA
jgi:branched-chain amino acid transport system permease protein